MLQLNRQTEQTPTEQAQEAPKSPEKDGEEVGHRWAEKWWCGVLNKHYIPKVCTECGYTVCGRCYLVSNIASPNRSLRSTERTTSAECTKCGAELKDEPSIKHYWGKNPQSAEPTRRRRAPNYREKCGRCKYTLVMKKDSDVVQDSTAKQNSVEEERGKAQQQSVANLGTITQMAWM